MGEREREEEGARGDGWGTEQTERHRQIHYKPEHKNHTTLAVDVDVDSEWGEFVSLWNVDWL